MLSRKGLWLPLLRLQVFIYGKPVLEASAKGHFICIFQLTTKGNTPCYGGHFYNPALEFFLDIKQRGISLDIGVERKYQFFYTLFFYTEEQAFNGKLVGAHAIEWRNNAPKYMVASAVLLGGFNGHYIAYGLHHTNR